MDSKSIEIKSSLEEAKLLSQKKKWNEVVQILRPLLKADPKSIAVVVELSAALVHLGQREEAFVVLNRSLEWARGTQRDFILKRMKVFSHIFLTNKTFQYFQDGMNQLLMRKYRGAIEKFEKTLTLEPDNIEVLLRLAQSLISDGSLDKGIEYLKKIITLNPYEYEARLWLGRAFYLKEKHPDALTELKTAYDHMAGFELACVWYAEGLFAHGQSTAAIRILDRDLKTWPLHVLSTVASAKFRLALAHVNSQSLWVARRDLLLALNRLNEYYSHSSDSYLLKDFRLEFIQTELELKEQIQKHIQQVEVRLAEANMDRSKQKLAR